MDKVLLWFKKNKIEFISVCLIFILALVLRLITVKNFGVIWYDEVFSWYFASRETFPESLYATMAEDIHMPLYFILLHFWIKIFGDNLNAMRIFSVILSLPLIPLGYYLSKKIFNKTTGYFAASFLAINSFCIYYCAEIRFYSLVLPLTLLLSYFFVNCIQNFDKKNIIGYIISASLLLYTFSIAPLLILIYALSGFIYLFYKNKEKLIEFLKINLIMTAVSLPAIGFTIANAILMKKAFTYYPIDNYLHDNLIINDILENFFTLRANQIYLNDVVNYSNRIQEISDPIYIFSVLIPVLIALCGLIFAFNSRKNNFYLFFIPSLTFLIVLFILSMLHMAAIQVRYLIIIFPIFVVAFCFGLSLMKNKIVSVITFLLFIYLNILGLFFSETTVYNLQRADLADLIDVYEYDFEGRSDDLFVAPLAGKKAQYYFRKAKPVFFAADSAFVLKDKKSQEFYLGESMAKFLSRETIVEYLMESYANDYPLETYEKNFYNKYIKHLKKGQRIILFSFFNWSVLPYSELSFSQDMETNGPRIVSFLLSKHSRDTFLILNKYLKLQKEHISENYGYALYAFEKE